MKTMFRKVKTTFNGLLIVSLFWGTIGSLAGCGDIPPVSILSSGRVTLSWNAVPGAASYDLYISTSPGVTTLNSYKITDVTTPATITDLEPNTTYYFMIVVYSDTGESRKSKEISYSAAETEGFIELSDIIINSEPVDKSLQNSKTTGSSAPEEKKVVKKTSQVTSKKPRQAVSIFFIIPPL